MPKWDEWRTPDGLLAIEGWSREGLTNEEIADNIGIARQTFQEWKRKYKDISDALKKGRAPLTIKVENALLKRALGYDYEESVKEMRLDRKTGKYELVETKRLKKHMPPDVTAQIFWLKNRRSDRWCDRKKEDVDIEAKEGGLIEIQAVQEQFEEEYKNGGENHGKDRA